MNKTVECVDAQEMHHNNPKNFYAPDEAMLNSIEPGNTVKVCANNTERFWVMITEVRPDHITGEVNNDLVCTDEHGLSLHDTIQFEKRHIYQIYEP